MKTESIVVGNHAFIFPEGKSYTSPEVGVAARNAQPAIDDAGWIDPGLVDSLKIQKSSDKREIFAPSPGQRRLYDVIEVNRDLKLTISFKEASPFMFENLYGTSALDATSTDYEPLKGSTKKGWLKIQQYDHRDEIVNTVDVYCFMEIDGEVEFGEETVGYDLTCRVLHSTLNKGTLIASAV